MLKIAREIGTGTSYVQVSWPDLRGWVTWVAQAVEGRCFSLRRFVGQTTHDTRALHQQIQHTVRYTELSPARFKDFWR